MGNVLAIILEVLWKTVNIEDQDSKALIDSALSVHCCNWHMAWVRLCHQLSYAIDKYDWHRLLCWMPGEINWWTCQYCLAKYFIQILRMYCIGLNVLLEWVKLFNGLAISQPQHLNRGLEHLRSYSNQSDLDMWAGALMIFRSRAFISIVKILSPPPRRRPT